MSSTLSQLFSFLTTTLVPLATLIASSYNLYLSYLTVPKLQHYESASERAARHSSTAAEQLHRTRTTQTAAAVAAISSFVSSMYLLFLSGPLGWWSTVGLSAVNGGACAFARTHVAEFWTGKARVPFVTGFNDAIRMSEQMVAVLTGLAGLWATSAVVGLVGAVMVGEKGE